MSGDEEAPVAGLARRVGIADWISRDRPEEKAAAIARLTDAGARVDGLDDTAALAAAHVSISPASALDAARAASDIVMRWG